MKTDLLQDARYGLRILSRNPGFAAVVILTLALGIGANTAIFSAVNAVLLHPLPWSDPERLVQIWETHPVMHHLQASYPDYRDWGAQSKALEQTAAYTAEGLNRANLDANGVPVEVQVSMISANLLSMLGIQPALGRNFLPDEVQPGRDKEILISQGLWKRAFGADSHVAGRQVSMDGSSMRIIGVLPGSGQMPAWADVLVPITRIGNFDLTNRKHHEVEVIGKLREGFTVQQAQAELAGISQRLARAYPVTNNTIGAEVVPLLAQITGDVRRPLLVALAAVGLVLLIACANVANLLLARAAARSREVAIRIALGAGRGRLVRQFLTESLLLSLTGALLGVIALAVFAPVLREWASDYLARAGGIGIDGNVLLFTLAATLITGTAFGLFPARQISARVSGSRLRGSVRAALAAFEIGLAVVVLISAGLLVRSFTRLLAVDPGFRSNHLLTFRVLLHASQYPDYPRVQSFYSRLLGNLRHAPGVISADVASILPLTTVTARTRFAAEGAPPPEAGHFPVAQFRAITPGLLRTMGIALRKGRTFTDAEMDANAPPVCIMNETLVRRYFNGRDPIGRHVILGVVDPAQQGVPIVGVAADTRESALADDAEPQIYFAGAGNSGSVVVRTSGDPRAFAPVVRAAMQTADPNLPVPQIRSMEEVVAASVARRRFLIALLTVFASLAVLLAAIGLYGVISWSVAQRTRELGLRKALGGKTWDLIRMVLAEGAMLGIVGVAGGALASVAVTRALSNLLFAMSATDPLTFAAAGITLLTIALAACIVPAWRAAAVEPMTALRHDPV